jgi:ABC-type sugar transport system permease subunit
MVMRLSLFKKGSMVSTPRRRKNVRSKYTLPEFLVFEFPLLIFVGLLYGMLMWTIVVSFTNWRGTAPNFDFAGLKWYRMMFTLERFLVDVANNLKWLAIGVVPTIILALLIAYLLELGRFRKVESYTRTLILYPVAMSFIVTGTIWSWMFDPDKGVINTILRTIGLGALQGRFVTNPATARTGSSSSSCGSFSAFGDHPPGLLRTSDITR